MFGMAQDTSLYKKISRYDEYKKDWAMVKTIANTYGFIDKSGNEVVPPIYSKIYKFEGNYAMVKNISGSYGFIDKNGVEIIKPLYFKKEEASQQLNHIKKEE